MYNKFFLVALSTLLSFVAVACTASEPQAATTNSTQAAPGKLPNPEEAKAAFTDMIGDPDFLGESTVKLGTCVPAIDAEHPGQTACTVAVISSGGSSETQADFHWDGKRWIAQPSSSQDLLPFPDPKLQ